MSVLQSILDMLTALLANEAAVSIVFGVVISLAGTQYLKFRVPMPAAWQDEYRWIVRLISLPLGFFPTYFSWPTQHRFLVALTVGLIAPYIYKLAVAIVYWKWPELEHKLSAQPPKCGAESVGR